MTQFTCKGVNRSITGYHLNTFTIRISQRFSSVRKFQMGNFQKYWLQNVGQDFIVFDFFVGGRSCGRKRCVPEINVSRAWDPVHAGDKALTRETPAKRGRVNRYGRTSTDNSRNALFIFGKVASKKMVLKSGLICIHLYLPKIVKITKYTKKLGNKLNNSYHIPAI